MSSSAKPELMVRKASAFTLAVSESTMTVTVGTGERRNVLGPHDWVELEQIAVRLAERQDIKAVVFRGAAETFCAGSDLQYWIDAVPETINEDFACIEAALQAVERIPVPTIAVIEGVAAGAGCELALACDLRIFAESARIGLPIVQLGMLVSPHFALRLSLLVGIARARELLFTGRLVGATEANLMGLATTISADAEVGTALELTLDAVRSQPLRGLKAAKEASSIALRYVRQQHEAPEWTFSDSHELPQRIEAFFSRQR